MKNQCETFDGSQLLKNICPEIKVKDFGLKDFKIYYYNDHESLILDGDKINNDFIKEVSAILDAKFEDFRFQTTIKSASLLVGVFYSAKEIRLYTPRLNHEMFLIHEVDSSDQDLLVELKSQEVYKSLKKHTEKVASLSADKFPSIHDRITKHYDLPEMLNSKHYEEIEVKSKDIVSDLLVHLNSYRPSLFERVSDFGLALTAQYALLRIHLLKFLAILPSLDFDKSGHEVKRILLEAIRRLIKDSRKAKNLKKKGQDKALPYTYILVCKFVYNVFKLMPASPLAKFVRSNVRFMAKRFIAGESIELAEESLKLLGQTGRDVTLDQLGELVVSEKEADKYCEEVIKLIRGFSLHVPKGERNNSGIHRAHVSIKVSALCSDFKPYAPEYTFEYVAPRLKKILLVAKQEDVFINIDAEHYDYRDIVFYVYKRVLLETPELSDFDGTGIVLQAYLRDAYFHFQEIVELAKERKIAMPVRIVKGAYWDAETVEADAHSYNAPEFLNKEETDLNFRQLIIKMFEADPHIKLCLASHNFADHCFAEALRQKEFSDTPVIEHQCLHMTYEALSTAMAKMGWTVRNYVPVGSLIVGMAYLVRRIMENSSQVGVLTIMRSHKKQQSMITPYQVHEEAKENGKLRRDKTAMHLTSKFFNAAPVRTYLKDERKWIEDGLKSFKESLGSEYKNSFLSSGEDHKVQSSSAPELTVGSIKFSTKEDANKAVEIIDKSYNDGHWSKAPYTMRTGTLLKAANIMLAKRSEFSALIVYEAGKAVNEALADVDEAIDFLNFYAREESRLQKINNKIISRGAIAVIAPWNFPLAIPCGMVVSSLVAGSTVVLKSAEQTPLIAQALVDILHNAGIPKDVLIHLPGEGEVVGEALVNHERIAGIVFTGSKSVGMMIAKKAGKRIYENKLYKQSYPVQVITEMGGKNAIIVTANAELDETVAGILYSAFGHSGQKCSACSRVFVDNSVKDRLIERLKEACLDIEVGKAFDFKSSLNPVITKEDKERLIKQTKEASEEAKLCGGTVHVDRSADDLPGYCVGPVVIELPKTRALHEESFAVKELFGPVLHVIGFDQLDEALEMYNGTEYALTGGVFSQSQDDIDYLTAKMESGNIYVNRSITGARVAIEPFGGFKRSGTGPKAGSKSYLTHLHVNPYKMREEIEYKMEDGHDVSVDLCGASGLSEEARRERMTKALDAINEQFEAVFKGLHGENKNTLGRFRKWVHNNFEDFILRDHKNRVIPGQLSFNDFTLKEGLTLTVSFSDRPDFSSVLQTLASVLAGCGTTVICRSSESYVWWSEFVRYLIQSGFSKENINCYFLSKDKSDKLMKNPDIKSLVIDSDLEILSDVLKELHTADSDGKRCKAVLTPFDSTDNMDFKRLLEEHISVRSFAVNTMRHGAPMEIEL